MRVWQSIARHEMPRRFAWLACALILALAPMTLTGQAPAAKPAAPQAQARLTAGPAPGAKDVAPLGPNDKILQQETYATPPPELAAAVTAPRYQNVTLANLSPDKKWFLSQVGDGPVPMSTFSKPFHELGGVFIDFKANRARTLTISNNVGIQVISAIDGTKKTLAIPANARVSNATWSPDGSAIAYFVHTDDATHVWMTDVATNKPRQITPRPVLATMVSSFDFTKDGKQIAVVLIPDNRPPAPVAPVAPVGPQVKVHDAKDKNRLRTFPSLMSTPYELSLLEWHATGQLALIDVAASAPKDPKAKVVKMAPAAGLKKIGQPAMIRALDVSPDGKYIRVTRMVRPFSYIVPVANFGSIDEVWDLDGKVLVKVTDRPLNLGTADANAPDPSEPPSMAAQQGKREIAWRDDGQGLTYLEQEPAPPAGEGGAGGARGARAAGGGARRRPGRRRPGPGPAAQGPAVPVAAALRGEGGQGAVREQHAHERPALLARHADDLLPRNERHGHDGEYGGGGGQPGRTGAALRPRAVPDRRPGGEPGQPGRRAAAAAAADSAAAAGCGALVAAAAGRCWCRPTSRASTTRAR